MSIYEEYVSIKSEREISLMRRASWIAAQALQETLRAAKPGVTTAELDRIAHRFIAEAGAVPASLGYGRTYDRMAFPKSICTSVNDVVCHGIPSETTVLKHGDIINVDIAVIVEGYHGDTSATVPVGTCSEQAQRLIDVTRRALNAAIAHVKPGVRTREFGTIIEDIAVAAGFSTVRDFVGHGVGRAYHEPPQILHCRNDGPSVRLRPGMTFTIEPMLNIGSAEVLLDKRDGWTVYTSDGSLSAQFEHTILVTPEGHEILTLP